MAEAILEWGLTIVLAFQGIGDGLIGFFNAFTFLGTEDFYLVLIPFFYWTVDNRLRKQMAVALVLSIVSNFIFKVLFHQPRPYWYESEVNLWAEAESSYGLPSGHAQTAIVLWGLMAHYVNKWWSWLGAVLLMFFIGTSRIYLGVHFPSDVLLGWAIGIILLMAIIRFTPTVQTWASDFDLRQKIGLYAMITVLGIVLGFVVIGAVEGSVAPLPDVWNENALADAPGHPIAPLSPTTFVTMMSAIFGFLAGEAVLATRGGFSSGGPLAKKVGRFVLGAVVLIVIWAGLDAVFTAIEPNDETFLGYVLRFIRYGSIGLWIGYLAPLVFIKLKLADPAG